MSTEESWIVVGVVPDQPPGVLHAAVDFAERFRARLTCAHVDSSRYPVEHHPDGTVRSAPLDPDTPDDGTDGLQAELATAVGQVLGDRRPWELRMLAGDPATELARLADALDAAMIVVGTREAGMRSSLHEFFTGSVAVQLAHRQHRPVVVVPLNPVSGDQPWQVGD